MSVPAKKSNNCRLHPAPTAKIRVIPVPVKKVYELDAMFTAMRKRLTVTMEDHTGIINGIQAEDGSGRSWLVKFHNRDKWMWVKAI